MSSSFSTMRGRVSALLVLIIALLALAACGGGAAQTPASPAAPEVAAPTDAPAPTEAPAEPADAPAVDAPAVDAPTEAPAADTLTVVDAAGNEVTIPANAQRVVALGERDMDAAFALGVPLVGVVNGRGAQTPPAYLQSYLGDAVSVGAFSAPSPEAVLNLNPDLIIIGGVSAAVEELLPSFRQIAPVYITYMPGDDWQTSFMGAAAGLNRTAEAEAWLADYNAHLAEVAAKLPEGAQISIVRFNPDGPVIMSPISFASVIAGEMGLTRPEAQMNIEGPGHGDTVSLEAIGTIDADHIFVGALNPEGRAILDEALANPLYGALKAVQNNAVSVVDGAVWTSLGGPLAAQTVVNDIAAAFGVK